jgi:glycosyltransferase involved in cell wall biosynthesis
MNILVAFGAYHPGPAGAERMAIRAAERLAGRGHRVAVHTDAVRPTRITQWSPGWRPELVHAFDLAKPDHVRAAARIARHFDVPFAVTPASDPLVWPDREGGLAVCQAADVVFVLTDEEAKVLRGSGVPPERLHRIPQACDLTGVPAPEEFRRRHGLDGHIVLFVGRRVATKGYLALLRAAPLVRTRLPDTTFVFIGPDGDADDAARFSAHAGPWVRDLGVVSEQIKHDAVAACDVLALPTSADVYPLVFAEAWSCGKPVVSGDFPGAADVVRHGVDGLIVRPEPDRIADALIAILTDHRTRAAMGRAAQRRAREEFGWEKVTDAIERGYQATGVTP